MEAGKMRRLFIGGIIALFCAQILYGALMLSAMYKQYQEPFFKVNGLLCKDMADHLSLLVRVGKSLRQSTLEKYFKPFRGRIAVENIIVFDANDTTLFVWNPKSTISLEVPNQKSPLFANVSKGENDDSFITSCPITDRNNQTVGNLAIFLDKKQLQGQVIEESSSIITLFLAITLGEILLLGALLFFYNRLQKKRAASSQKMPSGILLRTCFMLPLILGQILFLALLTPKISELYQHVTYQTGHQVIRQVSWDLERVIKLGMSISKIHAMDDWLKTRQNHIEALGMVVYDEHGQMHSAISVEKKLDYNSWQSIRNNAILAHRDIHNPDTGAVVGSVFVAMDPEAISRSLIGVMLDNLTLTIVAALFLSELVFLLIMSSGGLKTLRTSSDFMRPIIFACLFGTEMSMSYVPIRIGELGLELFGLPPDVVSGLPVSCELFMAGVAMLVGGFWSQRSGWRPMLFTGLLLSFGGAILSWLSPAPLPFILARGFSGLGYGFINLSAQVYVIAHSSSTQRARNLAFMFAGLYAGTLCGSALGGLIADRLGYQSVFPASAILLILLVACLWRMLPAECWLREKNEGRLSLQEALAFFKDTKMSALLLFFIIPNALITVCLFQFFVPLSLSQAGTSPASIGRVFLVYCIIVMFSGPLFGSIIDKARRMEIPLFASLMIAVASILSLVFMDGLSAAMLCVALLAMNTAIASNGQGAYALSLPAAQRFGRSRTMGFYNVAMRLGQVLGPLSLGIMISIWNVRIGLSILAAFTLVCAVIFLLLTVTGRKHRTI